MRTLKLLTVFLLLGFVVNSDAITLTLTWFPSPTTPTNDPPTAYNIKQSKDNSAYVTIGTVPANITSFVFSVTQAGIYWWRVSGTNSAGESLPAATFTNITTAFPPAAPTGCTVK